MTTSPEPTDHEAQTPDATSPEPSPEQMASAPPEGQPAPPEQTSADEATAEQAASDEAPEPATPSEAAPEQAASDETPEQATPSEAAREQPAATAAADEPVPVSPAGAAQPPQAHGPTDGPTAVTADQAADEHQAPRTAEAAAQTAEQQADAVLAADDVTGLPSAPGEADAIQHAAAPAADSEVEAAAADAGTQVTSEPSPPTSADGAEPTADATADAAGEGGKKRKRGKKGKGGGGEAVAEQTQQQAPKKKGNQPDPTEIVRRIGTTNEQALAYVANPDPKLSRLSKKVQEALLPELPPVTAGALLGPAALARHLVASAAAGRYRDLFTLWELFRQHPAECKPVLAERSKALEKGQRALRTSVILGLRGNATRVAEDVRLAQGLIWQWLREIIMEALPAIGARPAVASALLEREPDLDVPLPENPNARWLAEAAEARQAGPLAPRVEQILAENVHRLPATVETLRLATIHYPTRVEALVDRVDLDAPEIGAFLAWARDHGAAERLHGRIRERVAGTAARDRAEGLALWYSWQQRGVRLELPESLRTDSLEGFDLSRPETAELAARLRARGVELDLQGQLDTLAGQNRQLAEKAYEAMVCAGLDVHLPEALKDNPTVNPGTRCPNCQAWTWVRPGHEQRCPRPPAPAPEPAPDPFELAAAEVSGSDPQ